MIKKLHNLFLRFENERIHILDSIKNLSDEDLNKVPAPGKWSILQIIFHLVKTEKIAVISIQKNLKAPDKIYVAGLKASARFYLLLFALKTPVKFKAPAIVAKVPETYDFDALLKQWETARKSLKEIIDSFPPDEKKTGVFIHPYSGALNIVQTFSFLIEHLRHHKKQVHRILANSDSKI